MRIMTTIWLAIVTVSLMVSAQGADQKIAVADMNKVIQAHPSAEKNQQVLDQQAKEFDEERDALMAKLTKMREEFLQSRRESGNMALSEEARREKIAIAEKQLEEFSRFEQQIGETLTLRKRESADLRSRMRRLMVRKLEEIAAKYAEKNKINLLLDSSAIGLSGIDMVVFADDKLDVTEDLIKLVKQK
ncbi:MAG: OmpH family outer membrane protein [Lentisphaerae bacterium]|nr:OmpH family outer membrane protein [Lentisphaerota bacterium]